MSMNNKIREPNNEKRSENIADALGVVQEGLKSMQALQIQTAEAHMKFLEAQTEAARTLKGMVENTRRLTRPLPGLGEETDRMESIRMPAAINREIRSGIRPV